MKKICNNKFNESLIGAGDEIVKVTLKEQEQGLNGQDNIKITGVGEYKEEK